MPDLPEAARAHVERSYPHDHCYRVRGGRLAPTCQLWLRHRKVAALYPRPLGSLLDVSCSKGFFVLEAAAQGCPRAAGIEPWDQDREAAVAVRDHLGLTAARFEPWRLHQAVERLPELGGPFEVVVLLNVYHYLFLGSTRLAEGYWAHGPILDMLRAVCARRVVFANRLEPDRLQPDVREVARARGLEAEYTTARFLAAAEAHFRVAARGKLGKTTLYTLDVTA